MTHKVFIVDDDQAVSSSLALLLHSVDLDTEVFASAQAFLSAYKTRDPARSECLVSDVRMPGMSGLDLLDEIHRCGIDIPVIILSGHADVPMVVRAMRAGAVTFLEKPVNGQNLIDRIHEALHLSHASGVRRQSHVLDDCRKSLTPRQREIFDLILKGLQTKEIAIRLELSPRTVEVHRSKMLERLHVTTSAEMIRQLFDQATPG